MIGSKGVRVPRRVARAKRHARARRLSGRDKMTLAFDEVFWPIAFESVRGLSEHFQITLPAGGYNISVPTPKEEGEPPSQLVGRSDGRIYDFVI